MIIASFIPQNYQTISEVLAQAICIVRGGQAFSYLDQDLGRKELVTRYHLRPIRVQARLNGQIKSITGEELAQYSQKDKVELHVHLRGIQILVNEKSAMGSVRLKFKRKLAFERKNESFQRC